MKNNSIEMLLNYDGSDGLMKRENGEQEFYSFEQAIKRLDGMQDKRFLSEVSLIAPILEGKLCLAVKLTSPDGVTLSPAKRMTKSELESGKFFHGDNYFTYARDECEHVEHPSYIFSVVISNKEMLIRLANAAVYKTSLRETKYDVFLERDSAFFKVVDCTYDGNDFVYVNPVDFTGLFEFGLTYKSVENFGKKSVWNELAEDEKHEKAAKAFKNHKNKTKAAEELEISRVTLNKYLEIQSHTPIEHLIKK